MAAHKLAGALDVTIIEQGRDIGQRSCQVIKGKECIYCNVCNVTAGVGGAGGMSDGKLNFSPLVGGDWAEFVTPQKADELIDEVDGYFVEHGAPPEEPKARGFRPGYPGGSERHRVHSHPPEAHRQRHAPPGDGLHGAQPQGAWREAHA